MPNQESDTKHKPFILSFILIAEDDPTLHRLFEHIVHKLIARDIITGGCVYASGDELIHHLPLYTDIVQTQPVIVLTDFDMPGKNGVDVLTLTMDTLPTACIRIISSDIAAARRMMAIRAKMSIRLQAMQDSGIDYVLSKEFVRQQLQHMPKEFLRDLLAEVPQSPATG